MQRSVRFITFLFMLTPLCVLAEEDTLLKQAADLLSSNQPSDAMNLLEPHMDEYAGDLQYDYLLGRAALANNQANLAVFALERAVLTAPEQDIARFTLAKAYHAVGENKQASREFDYLVKTSKQKNIRYMSRDYLSRISNQRAFNVRLLLEAGLGSDSNVNSATHKSDFLGIDLTENSQARSSSMTSAGIKSQFGYQLNKTVSLNAGAEYYQIQYPDADFVNTKGTSIHSGISIKSGKNSQEKVLLAYNRMDVNNQFNNRQATVQVTHQHEFTSMQGVSASLRVADVRYDKAFAIKDGNSYNAGLQYWYKAQTKLRDSVLSALSVIAGTDVPTDSDSPYVRNYYGTNTNMLLSHHQGKIQMIAGISFVRSTYDHAFFGQNREDENSSVSLKMNVRIHPRWTFGPNVSYVRNHSTVDLYDYNRAQVSFFVRHQVI